MLREAFEWLLTPSLRGTRWSGHLSEFIAISARRRRHRAAWLDHEARSRAAVTRAATAAAAGADGAGTALVLGAGHANDIPLEDLSDRFERVVLVDLAFSGRTRRAAARLGNVECVVHDVTETLDALPQVRAPARWIDDPTIRFVASVNLMSQLATVATRKMTEDAAEAIGRRLVDQHLDWLRRFVCPVCLIADIDIEILDAAGQQIASLDPNDGAQLPDPTETWTWDIAPIGEVDRRQAVRHRVAAFDRI